jgi:hypothetical protein
MFPKQPRLVRERKLRMVLFTIFLMLAACALMGGMVYLLYKTGRK